MRYLMLTLGMITLATAATAQSRQGDPRWEQWVGCWNATQYTSGAGVCVARSSGDAVGLSTTVSGQPVLEETIVADGTDHPIADDECKGTRRAEWSSDGHRLF